MAGVGLIANVQSRIESLLLAEPYFSDIPIVPIDKGDVANIIEAKVQTIGLGILILTPGCKVQHSDMPGPFFEEITVVCQVIENTVVNQTGKVASDVAEYVASTVHQAPQPGGNVFANKGIFLLDLGENKNRQTLATYSVDFTVAGGLALDLLPAATPVLVDDGNGQITLTCATAGASIFYSTDGTNPGPQTGTLYTAPFTIISGTRVKARAWIWGYTVSAETTYLRA